MRVCMILEGSYPYVHGGVSTWTHQYISAMPDTEFILWCIGAEAENKGKYKYELPPNVVEVHELFLDDALKLKLGARRNKRYVFSGEEEAQLKHLFEGEKTDWDILFELFSEKKVNPLEMLMSRQFLDILMQICDERFTYLSFADFFYNVRSMILPELYLMTQEIPEADIYHATATGYSGILGSLGKWKYHKPFILSEHGIYTREREEELLRADWVLPYFRQQWTQLFYLFSDCAYSHADVVTALFHGANRTQAELGCDERKLLVTPNGVHYDRFCNIPPKKDDGWIDIGAVVRIAKIKDIRTMIYAFAEAKEEFPNIRLHIMGDVDDEEYFESCRILIDQLRVRDIIFTGRVDITDYMEKLDFTILTSISEGQPLAVLESFAAGRPCVTTDVGCCRELIHGSDGLGEAGICVPPMNKEQIALAILELCREPLRRRKMGEAGKQRVHRYYTHEKSMENYRRIYREVSQDGRDWI